jgi:hypothetical protein
MKLSIEAKMAAAVAAGLMVMTSGAMAQGHGKGQSAGPNHYGPTNNPGVNTRMSQQGNNNSLFGRTNAEDNKPTFSDEKVTSSVPEQGGERQKAREQREDRRENREQREDRRENREQRVDRRENREQRQDRHQAHRQREERRERENAKGKSPFDGSILDVKPGE